MTDAYTFAAAGPSGYEVQWDEALPLLGCLLLHAPVGDPHASVDARRLMEFSARWGLGGLRVRYVYQQRAAHQSELRDIEVLPSEWHCAEIYHLVQSPLVLVGYGVPVELAARARCLGVARMLRSAGADLWGFYEEPRPDHAWQPRHVRVDATPQPWRDEQSWPDAVDCG